MVDLQLRCLNPVIPLVYDDSLTYLECLGKTVNKLNDVIAVINTLDIDLIKQEMEDLKEYVDNTVSEVDKKLADNITYVLNLVDGRIDTLREDTANYNNGTRLYCERLIYNTKTDLEKYVDEVLAIPKARSVMTGKDTNLNEVLGEIYSVNRPATLTAEIYDTCLLKARIYDNYLKTTAYLYDCYGLEMVGRYRDSEENSNIGYFKNQKALINYNNYDYTMNFAECMYGNRTKSTYTTPNGSVDIIYIRFIRTPDFLDGVELNGDPKICGYAYIENTHYNVYAINLGESIPKRYGLCIKVAHYGSDSIPDNTDITAHIQYKFKNYVRS